MSTPARAALRHGPRKVQDVVIGYCRSDMVDGHFHDAVVNLLIHDREHDARIYATIGMESGPRISRARCEVVKTFLENTTCDWLVWLDTDMVPPPDMVDRLLEHADPQERPIVGALCFAGGRTKIVPTIYVIGTGEDGALESETVLSYPGDQLIEVGGTGSACLIIHRSVFVKILEMMPADHPLPWYQEVVNGNKDWGEDLIFCLRARSVGAHIFVHTGIKVGHRKKWTIVEGAFIRYAAQLDASVGGPEVFTAETMPDVEIAPELDMAALTGALT